MSLCSAVSEYVGQSCGMHALRGGTLCYLHDPSYRTRRQEWTARGRSARRTATLEKRAKVREELLSAPRAERLWCAARRLEHQRQKWGRAYLKTMPADSPELLVMLVNIDRALIETVTLALRAENGIAA